MLTSACQGQRNTVLFRMKLSTGAFTGFFRHWWDTASAVLNTFQASVFRVEYQGLGGLCSCAGDDPKLIPEVNPAFVSWAQVAHLWVDVTFHSGPHGNHNNTHLLNTSFGRHPAA